MNRIDIYTEEINGCEQSFVGWFDRDVAEEIASFKEGDCYVNGKMLLATAKGKLVVNAWNNTGYDDYRFADDEKEIAEILSAGGYDGDDKRLMEVLSKFEI